MELLLNLVWLLVVAVAIVSWLYHNHDRSSARPGVLLQVIALACILAVLFPAISATDDLHASQLAVEASDVARKVLRSMNTVSSSGTLDWLHLLPALLLLALAVMPRRKFFTKASQSGRMLPAAGHFSLLESRAPPARVSA
jgi:EamA domain-containing membrane protein RarD